MFDIEFIQSLNDYGLPGMVIFALFGIVFYIEKSRRDDLKEWRDLVMNGYKIQDERQRETNEVLRTLARATYGCSYNAIEEDHRHYRRSEDTHPHRRYDD